jgi:hypothetical protein
MQVIINLEKSLYHQLIIKKGSLSWEQYFTMLAENDIIFN